MTQSPRPAAVALSSAAALLALAAIAAGPANAAMPAFYTPPSSLPATNGALVRSQAMKLGVGLSGTATRIMYKSTDTNGNPVAVTGTYIEPTKKYAGTGPRPLVTYAEGTQGQGDLCAPSLGLENTVSGGLGSLNVGYEVTGISGLLDKGLAVVVTDYVGLGTPGVHTYVNRVDQGNSVLDAARAALQVQGASVTPASPVGAYGYSQGGGAAASAAELAATYAPDVNLKAVYAGAPPADLATVLKTADGSSLTGVIGYAINGFLRTYPALQPILDSETNATGKTALSKISTQCIVDTTAAYGFKKTSEWTKSGKTVAQIVAANPTVKAVVDAQRIGTLKPSVPVRVLTGTKDDIVTHAQVKQLALDWCAKGANVNYVPVNQLIDTGGTGLNHIGPVLTESAASATWITDRLGGKPATSNCSSVSSMP